MTNPMDGEARRQRLRELHDAMTVKRRYVAPPEAEADQWILGYEDTYDEHGRTVKRGIPVYRRQGGKATSGTAYALALPSRVRQTSRASSSQAVLKKQPPAKDRYPFSLRPADKEMQARSGQCCGIGNVATSAH
ncbi:MAG: hypothetical protein CBARDCOR_6832 [uncultured Caballeronia sp.]|nr:MAG: hypothetical protein CBARDCOR_6832 [uncultured Caballeronia sp.]